MGDNYRKVDVYLLTIQLFKISLLRQEKAHYLYPLQQLTEYQIVMNKYEQVLLKGYTITKEGFVTGIRKKVLTLRPDKYGYYRFVFRTKDRQLDIYYHKLQAYIKYGKSSLEKGIETRHLDGNPKNNTWNNIAIGSRSDNKMDMPKDTRLAISKHANYIKSLKPKYNNFEIIQDKNSGMKRKNIMRKHGISSTGTYHLITTRK